LGCGDGKIYKDGIQVQKGEKCQTFTRKRGQKKKEKKKKKGFGKKRVKVIWVNWYNTGTWDSIQLFLGQERGVKRSKPWTGRLSVKWGGKKIGKKKCEKNQ